jgi:hypothetical protein
MNKVIPILLILFISGCSSTKPVINNQWIDFDFQRASAYYSETALFDEEFVISGKLNPLISDSIGVSLSEKRIHQLNRILSSPDKYIGYPVMECFLPRHGVVFWDKDNKPIAWISVCFECGNMKANPNVDKEELIGLRSFFKDVGFRVN